MEEHCHSTEEKKLLADLVHIPKFRNGTGKILANASTSLLGLLRANTRIFPVPRI
jgi:hypothetical protein